MNRRLYHIFVLVALSIQNYVLEIITSVILHDFGWSSAPFNTCVPLHVVFIIPKVISNLVF